jgi:HK97 family phage major capsid protein
LILYKFTKIVRWSNEFADYNGTNFDAFLTGALGRAAAVTENSIFTTGSGSSDVEGLNTAVVAGSTELAVDTTLVLGVADLTELVGTIDDGYNVASECGFLMKNATKWYLHGLAGSNYYPFAQIPAIGPTASGQNASGFGASGFLGYPAYVSDDMGVYTSTTGHSVIFGNMSYYAIVERPGIMVQRNPYLYMATGETALFAHMLRGGGLLQTEAFAFLHGKA